jgi:GNAT superfamily N-acetyltransferase
MEAPDDPVMSERTFAVERVRLDDVLELRELYRREMNCQVVHDSWHRRGFTDLYVCRVDGETLGHAAVGGAPDEPRITVKEFYVHRDGRRFAQALFRKLLSVSGARAIQAQTNDVLLSLMLFDFTRDWSSDTILFEDAQTTGMPRPPGVTLRPVTGADADRVFQHHREPVGDWGLEFGGELAATGGLAFHYNPPYGDIYMEVDARHRRRGFGSYLVQELKRICRESGSIPAARCGTDNEASRRTLERAGMFPCARVLRGTIAVG